MDPMDFTEEMEQKRVDSLARILCDLFPQGTPLFEEISKITETDPESLFEIFRIEENPINKLTQLFEKKYSKLSRAFELRESDVSKTAREIAETFCALVGKQEEKAISLVEKTLIARDKAVIKFTQAFELFKAT